MANTIKFSEISDAMLTALHHDDRTLMLRGGAGLGKSEFMKDASARLKWGFLHDSAPSLDSPDVRGYLWPQKDAKGSPESTWIRPAWNADIRHLVEAGWTDGVYFIDEWMAATRDYRKAALALINERRIGNWEVPDGWVIWVAGNRSNDQAGSDTFMGHEINKMCVMEIEPDIDSWLTWASKHPTLIHPLYMAYAQRRAQQIFYSTPPDDPDQPRATPRSFTYASQFHQHFANGLGLDCGESIMKFVHGFVGIMAREMTTFFRIAHTVPSPDQIVAAPDKAPVPDEEQLDAQYVVAQLVVEYADNNNYDAEKLFAYAMRLKKDLQVSVARQIINRPGGNRLNNSQLFSQFLLSNRALVAAAM